MTDYIKYALELHQEGNKTKAEIARQIKEKFNLEADVETLRKRISRTIIEHEHSGLKDECDNAGAPVANVTHYWVKTKTHSAFVKVSDNEQAEAMIDVIRDIVSNYNPDKIRTIDKSVIDSPVAIKATVSDMHVGLEPNPGNNSLFAYEYNEQIFKSNLDKVFRSLCKEHAANGKFDVLVIDDLGDGLDGYNGYTTRAGHPLDQNMSNEDMFRVFVEGKLNLIENCIKAGIANQVIVRNVANDNHAGSFAGIANMTIQMILNRTYSQDDVKFHILNRFMEHFEYGDHTFILTHGKDAKHMFKGLPYNLNDKAVSFINDYIDHYNIRSKYIHLEKGDLHRVGYDRTKKFDYRNYMTFAPPSAFVQHNFGDCYSGYSIQTIPKFSSEISHTDYYFELEKKL
jgi:hypothetical protein